MTTRKTLSAIINGKQSITPEMALKLAKAFNTSAQVLAARARKLRSGTCAEENKR